MNRDFCKPCTIFLTEVKNQQNGVYSCCKYFMEEYFILDKTRTDGCPHRILDKKEKK